MDPILEPLCRLPVSFGLPEILTGAAKSFRLGPWKAELVRSGFAVMSADVRGAGRCFQKIGKEAWDPGESVGFCRTSCGTAEKVWKSVGLSCETV